MQHHGWILLFHERVVKQMRRLQTVADRAQRTGAPGSVERNANLKLFQILSHLMLETIPSNPTRDEYRQIHTLGPAHRYWRRAKIGQRVRVFFRYDFKAKTVVLVWIDGR